MKLLNPRDASKRKHDSELSEKQRLAELHSLLEGEIAQVGASRIKNEEIRKGMEDELEQFSSEHYAKIASLKKEIEEIEKRREYVLKPIKELEQILDNRKSVIAIKENELTERLEDAKRQENDIELRKFTYNSKIASATAREDEAKIKQTEIHAELETIKAQKTDLANAQEAFKVTYEESTKRLQDERSVINQKEVELAQRENLLLQGNTKLKQERLHLESQQETLAAAFNEARKKNLL